ncbi:MAG: DUF433 domain-containing protein [Burkholderiaceae bacterium]|nr:DUF433 domain-containing protein [Burkholderiaceae bacterium]
MNTPVVDSIPLALDTHGVYRVGSSRVSLDVIVNAFSRGATAEEIAQDFPSLQLSEIYQVIGYYLKHGPELSEYFRQRSASEHALLSANENEWSPPGLRERLLARRANP